jgi:hypothetical protein
MITMKLYLFALLALVPMVGASLNCNLTETIDYPGLNGTVTVNLIDDGFNITNCSMFWHNHSIHNNTINQTIINETIFFNLSTTVFSKPDLENLTICSPPQAIGNREEVICLDGTYYKGSRHLLQYNGIPIFEEGGSSKNPALNIILNSTLQDELNDKLTTGIDMLMQYQSHNEWLIAKNGEWKANNSRLILDYQNETSHHLDCQTELAGRLDGFWTVAFAVFIASISILGFNMMKYMTGRKRHAELVEEPYDTYDKMRGDEE